MSDARRGRPRQKRVFLGGAITAILLMAGVFVFLRADSVSPSQGHTPGSFKAFLAPALDGQRQADIANAIQLLTARCMRSKHYVYFPSSNSAAEYQEYGDVSDPMFVDVQRVRSFGYGTYLGDTLNPNGTSSTASVVQSGGHEARYLDTLSRQQIRAYTITFSGNTQREVHLPDGKTFFTSPDGCEGWAYGEVYGTTKRDWGILHYTKVFTLAQDVIDGVGQRVAQSRGVQGAMSRWSSCMARAGLDFPSRNVEFATLVRAYQSHPKSVGRNRRRELAYARMDASCTVRVKLNRASEQATRFAVKQLTDSAADALKSWWNMQLAAASKSARILKGQS